ncbi:MAG: ferrous iron transport protein B [Armatimonadetes bacterium]|nr:ferrous iron transport protein B [Armatimonadota bacterium]MDE2206923.1 ferrous iron transport protein B [Armatimonadota bacterium]
MTTTASADASAQSGAGRRGRSSRTLALALVGNPNCGKTTLFNALTGMRQKVGNYPGVTVEKKEGRLPLPGGGVAAVLDLPGLYSLTPHSPDEVIAREVLMGLRPGAPKPDVIINVVDGSNLERNLYLTSQLLDLGVPVVVALTMADCVEKEGVALSAEVLQAAIGVPVCRVVAGRREGLDDLIAAVEGAAGSEAVPSVWTPPEEIRRDIQALQTALQSANGLDERAAFAEAVSLLMEETTAAASRLDLQVRDALRAATEHLSDDGIDFASCAIEARYEWIARVCTGARRQARESLRGPVSPSDRLDRLVMHPFWGYVIFLVVMAVVFQSIFSWVQAPMSWLQTGVDLLGRALTHSMPSGSLRDLLRDGVLGGVGNTIVFLPQILLLFFFVSLLEDTGYMARAAFLMDRLMSKVGLHGKSFIPLLSSFACAIPGIMATRTIGDRKARLITILVAPLMSCSARLPVYALMIGAFVPGRRVLGIGGITLLTLPGVTLLAMYLLGMVAAFCAAWVFHRTLLRGVSPTFLMELPPYRAPNIRTVAMHMLERAGLFMRRAGTIILAVSVLLWFLSAFPRHHGLPPAQQVEMSYVGRLGHGIEPLIRPLGFNWKMGIGIVSSFVAREVFVSAMGTVYNVANTEGSGQVDLKKQLRADLDPRTGRPTYTPLVAVCLMIYYVLAMQCISTLAVVRRETNSWKWPIFQLAYMSGLAWMVTFIVYQGGKALGWG